MEDVKKCLTVLNNALLKKTFLVGERVTLADISVACNLLMLYKQVCEEKQMLSAPCEVNAMTRGPGFVYCTLKIWCYETS